MTRAEADHIFTASIRARHRVLGDLYDGALSNWREHKTLGQRRHLLYQQDSAVQKTTAWQTEEHAVTEALTLASWTAQDFGNALCLIVDYSIKRYKVDAGIDKNTALGANLTTATTFSTAIEAMADHARHFDVFQSNDVRKHNVERFESLGLSPQHDKAPTQFLDNLAKGDYGKALASYADFESLIIRTTHP